MGGKGSGRKRESEKWNHQHTSRWSGMMDRCHNPHSYHYHYYGGRGIRVCDEWHNPFTFYEYLEKELGPCPSGYSMDRIDNDGNYEPGNIRWATPSEQAFNRRSWIWRVGVRKPQEVDDEILALLKEASSSSFKYH